MPESVEPNVPGHSRRVAGCGPGTSQRSVRTATLRLVDRTKDLIKSGGEWISSVELEAAEIAVQSRRWMERPVACIVVKDEATLAPDQVRDWLAPLVARWWLPDEVEFLDEIPRRRWEVVEEHLRNRFAARLLP
jgi:fatty-acyl-CoA synthase